MSLALRPYQHEAIQRVRLAFLAGHRAVLFVLPTGGGKTVVFSHIAQQAAAKGHRVGVLVHRVELLDQACRALDAIGLRHGVIAANRSMNLSAPVQVASVQTLARRLDWVPPDFFQLLIVDEAHHSNAGTWAQLIRHFRPARLLGVTATPLRSDGRGLGEFYSALVLGPTAAWLNEAGYLAPARVFAPPLGFCAKGLRKRLGDYDLNQAATELAGSRILGDAVSHYERHLHGRTAIAFCCSLAHAEAVAAAFCQRGIKAASIDGSMDTIQRRSLLAQLASGELLVLTSCSLIGEGVDVPSVAGCLLLRPTMSLALHLQMIGRCLRPQPGKQAVILDHVGNIERLGHHLDPQQWSLESARKREQAKAAAIKTCPHCFAAMASTISACPECGHLFRPQRPKLVTVAGELQELSQQQLSIRRRQEQKQARSLDELIALGQQRGHSNPHGWAHHVHAARSNAARGHASGGHGASGDARAGGNSSQETGGHAAPKGLMA